MALKNDSEVRYGTPAELHGVKFQVPHTSLEKNSYKRTDEGDKQVTGFVSFRPLCCYSSSFGSSPVNYYGNMDLLSFVVLDRR